jgi:hypothetical protein
MPKKKRHQPKTINEDKEIESLKNALIQDEAPNQGFAPSLHQQMSFRALPLSDATLTSLE